MKMLSFKIFIVVTVVFTTISSWVYAFDYRSIPQTHQSIVTGRNIIRGGNAVVKTIAERKSVPFGHTVNVNVALIAETVGEDYNSRSCIALDSDGWLGVRNIEILYYAGLDSLMYKISREIKYDPTIGAPVEEKVTENSPIGEFVYIVEYKYNDSGDIDEITVDQYDQKNNLLATDTIPGYLIHDYYDDENAITVVGTLLKYRLRAGSIKIHTNPILLGTFAENTIGFAPIVIQGSVTNLDSEGKPYSYSSASFKTTIGANK